FENEKNDNRYVTLSRTANLSRQLSLFFKLHINRILLEGGCSINGQDKHPRNVCICYSGGDDLFIVGAWNEVVELAVDVRRAFSKFTQETLSLSAGIGLYEHDYPVSAGAKEVAQLEDAAKRLPDKNAVTVFEAEWKGIKIIKGEKKERKEKRGTYYWREFEEEVLGEKLKVLREFLQGSEDRGMSFIYNLLELLRSPEEKINFARYVYILSRLEPGREAKPEKKEAYLNFTKKMYPWYKKEEDRRQLITAIYLYVYLNRQKEEPSHEG
ncbi:MAG: type III-A CRISPR-associated protein Cas10/Csm1, partial [Lachnospiraceae bacterium]|nr:type III-A CRISPR-associated protein Cas10/Csm1 [Lachnospiraceae bacterium]